MVCLATSAAEGCQRAAWFARTTEARQWSTVVVCHGPIGFGQGGLQFDEQF
jgi:hypothetical protein